MMDTSGISVLLPFSSNNSYNLPYFVKGVPLKCSNSLSFLLNMVPAYFNKGTTSTPTDQFPCFGRYSFAGFCSGFCS